MLEESKRVLASSVLALSLICITTNVNSLAAGENPTQNTESVDSNKEELPVRFYVKDGGGNLVENHEQIKEVVKSATKNTKLTDVLPDVNPNPNYKFAGWFETVNKSAEKKVQDIDDRQITDSKGEYYAKFFSDFNDNNIDDKTEEITVDFVTNTDEKIDPVKLKVGQKISAPKLSSKDKIFMGWYTNKELTNKFADDNIKEPTTLYAKWENSEKVINESETNPITDKNISDQVEKILNDRLKGLESSLATNDKTDTNNTEASNSNVIPSTNSPEVAEENPTQNNSNVKDDVSNSDKVSVYTETKYVFKNKNINEKYMVKFYDKNGSFISSLTLPYGKTLKLLDENGNLQEEYAVRQDTSIKFDKEKYVDKDSKFLGLATETVNVNSSEVTEISPDTVKNKSSDFLYKHDEQDDINSKVEIMPIVLSVIAAFCIILAILLFLKKRKKREQDEELNTNN